MGKVKYYDKTILEYKQQQRNKKRYRNIEGTITLTEAIEIARANWEGNLEPQSISTYMDHLKEFKTFAHHCWPHPCRLIDIDKFMCADYRSYLNGRQNKNKNEGEKLSGRTIQLKLDSVRALFSVLKTLGYIDLNPMAMIEHSKIRSKRKFQEEEDTPCPLQMEDVEKMLKLDIHRRKWALRDQIMVYFLILFAPRNVELLNLKWTDLNGELLTIRRVKHNRPGKFFIPKFLLDLLYEMRERYGLTGNDPIFISQYRREFSPNGIRTVIKKIGDEVGLSNLLPKHFRTLLLTILSEKYDPKTIQAFIGHLTPDTAMKYYEKRPRKELQTVLDVWVKEGFAEKYSEENIAEENAA